jgi:hypothetical protein
MRITDMVPNYEFHSVKWIINQISIPIGTGNRFWFHFNQPMQESRSLPLLLGKLSTIHHFIGNYALAEISPIQYFDWNYGWIVEEGKIFWMNIPDLILDSQQ